MSGERRGEEHGRCEEWQEMIRERNVTGGTRRVRRIRDRFEGLKNENP